MKRRNARSSDWNIKKIFKTPIKFYLKVSCVLDSVSSGQKMSEYGKYATQRKGLEIGDK